MKALRIISLAVLTLVAIGWYFASSPIPQDLEFHKFSDQRSLLGIPNFADVFSNLSFVVIGALGLLLIRDPTVVQTIAEKRIAAVFFAGVGLVGIGSGYYHLAPDNASLVWDRIPMTLAFCSFLALVIAERVSERAGTYALIPLLLIGVISVLSWHWSESRGEGDLRPYILVQSGSLALILLLVLLFPARYDWGHDIVIALAVYMSAKLCEAWDAEVYSLGHLISGHTLKHLLAATAIGIILRSLRVRRRVDALAEARAIE